MDIIVAFKVVPDDEDITVAGDGTLDESRAHQVVSVYDLNAIEAGAQLAAQVEGSKTTAISVGTAAADDSKLRKNVLARGMDELLLFADDAAKDADTHQNAAALAALVGKLGAWDVIICGDGSADDYNQQVDVQLAALLGVPVVNAVTSIEPLEGKLKVERVLETEKETLLVPLPAVISVSPSIALPRICGMKDILAAGKKPVTLFSSADIPIALGSVDLEQIKAPEQLDRKKEIYELSNPGDLDAFVQAALQAIR
jgi:electron transfer flavoprotein beta subunit